MTNYHPAFQSQITIDDTNDEINNSIANVTVTQGTYDDIHALLVAVEVALDAIGVFAVSLSSTGFTTITRTGANFDITWVGGNTIGPVLGFTANDTGAASYTGDNQHQYGWYPEQMLTMDSFDRPSVYGGSTFIAISGAASRTTFGTVYKRRVRIQYIYKDKFFSADSATNEDFQTFWGVIAEGTPFSFYSSTDTAWAGADDEGQYVLVVGGDSSLIDIPRQDAATAYYDVTMDFIKQP